jgi:cysteine-rich repeat protein
VINSGEQCDDNNNFNDDTCNGCQYTFCGDGTKQWPNGKGLNGFPPGFNEACDDGNPSNLDQCNVTCGWTRCGDNITQPLNGMGGTEQCDYGNLNNNDGCSSTCQLESCGNGVINPGEYCDGTNLNGQACIYLTNAYGVYYTGGTLSCTASCTFNTNACTSAVSNCSAEDGVNGGLTGCRSSQPAHSDTASGTCLSGQQCYRCKSGYYWNALKSECALPPGWCGPTPFSSPFTAHCGGVFGFTQACLDLSENQACCTACLLGYDYDCEYDIQPY